MGSRQFRLLVVLSIMVMLPTANPPLASAFPAQATVLDMPISAAGTNAPEVSIMTTLIDIFSCRHRPNLPWCR